jgi:hypothetical protein
METVDFTKVIGLSRQDCECIPQPGASMDESFTSVIDVASSLSGLWLDETEGLSLKLADSSRDCGDGSVWEVMDKAREAAIKHFEADTLSRLTQAYDEARQAYVGTIGTLSYRGKVDKGQEGFTIQRADLPGTTLFVDRVGAVVAYDGEVRISFVAVDKDPQTGKDTPARKSFVVVCSAYTPTLLQLPEQVRVPMNGEEFTVEIELAEGGVALSNNIPCGCGLKDKILSGYFPEFPSSAGGAILEGSITCDPMSVVYNNYKTRKDIAQVVAFMLRYKAAELLLEAIASSGEISRFTMMSRETLWGKRNHFRAEYATRLDFLSGVNGYNIKLASCFACKEVEDNRIRKGSILV